MGRHGKALKTGMAAAALLVAAGGALLHGLTSRRRQRNCVASQTTQSTSSLTDSTLKGTKPAQSPEVNGAEAGAESSPHNCRGLPSAVAPDIGSGNDSSCSSLDEMSSPSADCSITAAEDEGAVARELPGTKGTSGSVEGCARMSSAYSDSTNPTPELVPVSEPAASPPSPEPAAAHNQQASSQGQQQVHHPAASLAGGSTTTPPPHAVASPADAGGRSEDGISTLSTPGGGAKSCGNSSCGSDNESGGPSSGCSSPAARMSAQEVRRYVLRYGLARCVLVRRLGAGGCGYVDLVNISLPDGTVMEAVRKTLTLAPQCDDCPGAQLRSLLTHEVQGMMAAADCPHAVRILSHTRLHPARPGQPLPELAKAELLMQYVSGSNLKQYLDSLLATTSTSKFSAQPRYHGATLMPLPHLRLLAAAMLRVAKTMHSRGCVHMDFRAENVLVDCSGEHPEFFVADMGGSQAIDVTTGMLLSPARAFSTEYASPEVRQQHECANPESVTITTRADCFSIGVVLAQAAAALNGMILGTLRFALGVHPLPAEVPASLASLIKGLTAPRAEDRLTVDAALAHPFFQEEVNI